MKTRLSGRLRRPSENGLQQHLQYSKNDGQRRAQRKQYVFPSKEASVGYYVFVLATVYAIAILVWYVLAEMHVVNQIFFPHPKEVFAELWQFFFPSPDHTYWGSGGSLYWDPLDPMEHYLKSFFRLALGLVLGTCVGVALGVFASLWLESDIIYEWLYFLPWNNLPRLVYSSLLVMAFGFSHLPIVVSIMIVVSVTVSIVLVVRLVVDTDKELKWSAESLGGSPLSVLWRISLPLAVPSIFAAVQIAIGRGVSVLVLTEWLASSDGLGFLMYVVKQRIATDVLWALGIVTLATVAFFKGIAVLLERKISPRQ